VQVLGAYPVSGARKPDASVPFCPSGSGADIRETPYQPLLQATLARLGGVSLPRVPLP
jgi:hypothetical protein